MNWKFWENLDSESDGSTSGGSRGGLIMRAAGGLFAAYVATCLVLAWWWDTEPDQFTVRDNAAAFAQERNHQVVTGYITTTTLITITQGMLDKRGGYLSNDVFPPGVWMDNVPNWEFGVLTQIRDTARAYRIEFSRSQSQSTEDVDLAEAEGKFFFNNASWVFPQTESQYREGIRHLEGYLNRLADPSETNAQFYTRADNLQQWLKGVETRLGSLSQRLSASVGKRQLNIDLAGDTAASQSTDAPMEQDYKTPWLEIDDVFYEARGHSWALLHLLRAMEQDFGDVLDNKNARVSLQQIIRELEPTQDTIWSPMILNGDGFGFLANHSLVMASYISRANAAIIDLRSLLAQG